MIDLRLDEEQQLIRETVHNFAMEKIRPAAHDADESGLVPDALVAQAWELGLVQGAVPEQYGGYGQGSSAVTATVIAEAMAEGDLAVAMHVLSPRLVVDPVLLLGTEEQKKEILPRYCGEKFVAGSAAVCEQNWDFTPGKMKTRARRMYESALKWDKGDTVAADGLQRLSSPEKKAGLLGGLFKKP